MLHFLPLFVERFLLDFEDFSMPDNLHAFSQVIQDERQNYQLTEADSHFLAIIEKHAAH